MNSHVTDLVLENTKNSQVPLYLTDLELVGTHAITNVWECANFYTTKLFCGKPYLSKAVDLGNSNNPQSISQVKYHTMGIPKVKLVYFHTMNSD